MSGEELKRRMTEAANRKTPDGIVVNRSIPDLIVWATGEFGPWVVVSILAVWLFIRFDNRWEQKEQAVLDAYRQSMVVQEQTNATLENLRYSIELNTAVSREIYREVMNRDYKPPYRPPATQKRPVSPSPQRP